MNKEQATELINILQTFIFELGHCGMPNHTRNNINTRLTNLKQSVNAPQYQGPPIEPPYPGFTSCPEHLWNYGPKGRWCRHCGAYPKVGE